MNFDDFFKDDYRFKKNYPDTEEISVEDIMENDNDRIKRADRLRQTIKEFFDGNSIPYFMLDPDNNEFAIIYEIDDDLQVPITLAIEPELESYSYSAAVSYCPTKFVPSTILLLNEINGGLRYGSFHYDSLTGVILYHYCLPIFPQGVSMQEISFSFDTVTDIVRIYVDDIEEITHGIFTSDQKKELNKEIKQLFKLLKK